MYVPTNAIPENLSTGLSAVSLESLGAVGHRVNWVPLLVFGGLAGLVIYAVRKNKNFVSDIGTHIAASAIYDALID